MRIISGKLKGKLINFLKNSTTRPLKDSVKENIYNVLKHSNMFQITLEKANILDLYSGIGSFGLECISRGAEKVTFIEKDKNALSILEKNLTQLSIFKNAKMMNNNVEDVLLKINDEKYDIFFLDPPFSEDKFIKSLSLIKKSKIYKKKHIVVIHREKKSNDALHEVINVLDVKQYGRSKIIFGTFN